MTRRSASLCFALLRSSVVYLEENFLAFFPSCDGFSPRVSATMISWLTSRGARDQGVHLISFPACEFHFIFDSFRCGFN